MHWKCQKVSKVLAGAAIVSVGNEGAQRGQRQDERERLIEKARRLRDDHKPWTNLIHSCSLLRNIAIKYITVEFICCLLCSVDLNRFLYSMHTTMCLDVAVILLHFLQYKGLICACYSQSTFACGVKPCGTFMWGQRHPEESIDCGFWLHHRFSLL